MEIYSRFLTRPTVGGYPFFYFYPLRSKVNSRLIMRRLQEIAVTSVKVGGVS